jgi:hypothetical protein
MSARSSTLKRTTGQRECSNLTLGEPGRAEAHLVDSEKRTGALLHDVSQPSPAVKGPLLRPRRIEI